MQEEHLAKMKEFAGMIKGEIKIDSLKLEKELVEIEKERAKI